MLLSAVIVTKQLSQSSSSQYWMESQEL